MARIIEAKISKSALRHNIQRVRQIAPNSKIIAMIKANGYGHGALTVAKTLAQEVDVFGVASIEGAIDLRDQGIQNSILLVEGCFDKEEQVLVQTYQFSQMIHSWYQFHQLKEYRGTINRPFDVWVKINTGMNRLGFSCDEALKIFEALSELNTVNIIGFMTHFPVADVAQSPFTQAQLLQFDQCLKGLKTKKSLANSAGILTWPTAHADWVRPGLMLYGASPFANKVGQDHGLKPVMTLQAELIAIRTVNRGESVGYGADWVCDKPTATIGVVDIGYGDGYPWHAKSGTPVRIKGQNVPLAGRVSMDMLAIDLSSVPNPKVGDKVILWGDELPVEIIAKHAATIPYELFCRLTARVTMVGVD